MSDGFEARTRPEATHENLATVHKIRPAAWRACDKKKPILGLIVRVGLSAGTGLS